MYLTKKYIVVLVFVVLCASLSGCRQSSNTRIDENKYTIMTTLFPYYDFARAVVGNVEGIDIKLVVSPGQDNHSFEPTPSEVIAIDKSDLFIYNGGSIETWVDEVLDSLDKNKVTVMKMLDEISEDRILNSGEGEGNFALEQHKHDEVENYSSERINNLNEEGDKEQHSHEEEMDEHIWASPVNAQILVEKICSVLCKEIPEHAENFQANAQNYINELKNIDREFREVVSRAENKEIIFADKFPLRYFAKEYGLRYYAAFPGCSSDTEPSAKTVIFLIDKVKAGNVKGVFYLELSSQIMADAICEDTGIKKYLFESCHNVTQKQFDSGVTYIDLMYENVNALKKALK